MFKQYFVGDNAFNNGIPTRSGYLIGYYVIECLHKDYHLSEIITWKQARVNQEAKKID